APPCDFGAFRAGHTWESFSKRGLQIRDDCTLGEWNERYSGSCSASWELEPISFFRSGGRSAPPSRFLSSVGGSSTAAVGFKRVVPQKKSGGAGFPLPAPPPHDHDKATHQQEGTRARHPQHAQSQRCIFSGVRIELTAEKKNLVDCCPNSIMRCLYQTEPQIGRRIINAVKILREFAFRRQNVYRARMRERCECGIPFIAESHRISHPADRIRLPRQKMPATRGFRAAERSHICLLFGQRLGGRFPWIETDHHDVVIFARREGQLLRRPHHAIEDLGTEHRALVIDQGQYHGPLAEIAAQRNRLPVFIAK